MKLICLILAFVFATTAFAGYETGAANQVLRVGASGGRPQYGAVDLSQSAAVTNQLGVANGGTGAASLTANGVVIGNGTSALTTVAPGSSGQALTSNGTSWVSQSVAGTTQDEMIDNLGLSISISANALTVALKQNDGSTNATSTNPVKIGFRSSTVTTGGSNIRSVTGALSVTIPSATTIGTVSTVTTYVYVYALDNAGTVELALSLSPHFDAGSVQNTSAIAGGTSSAVLYSTAARTSVPVRLVGRFKIAETVAGTWASNPSEVSTVPFTKSALQNWAGFHSNDCDFTFTSTSFANTNIDASCTFTSRSNHNFGTVTSAGGSNSLPGFVFTPADAPSGYRVCAGFQTYNSGSGHWNAFQFTDGTTTFGTANTWFSTASRMTWVYFCGTYVASAASSTTIQIQALVDSASTGEISSQANATPAIEWTVDRLW